MVCALSPLTRQGVTYLPGTVGTMYVFVFVFILMFNGFGQALLGSTEQAWMDKPSMHSASRTAHYSAVPAE